MFATMPAIHMADYTSALLSGISVQRPACTWAVPADHPAYRIPDIALSSDERTLSAQERSLIWAALIGSSTLAYEF
jgi:hypothetical protein